MKVFYTSEGAETDKSTMVHYGSGEPPEALGKDGDIYIERETVFDGMWLKQVSMERQGGWMFMPMPLFPGWTQVRLSEK